MKELCSFNHWMYLLRYNCMPGTVPDPRDKLSSCLQTVHSPVSWVTWQISMSYDNCDNGPMNTAQRGTWVCLEAWEKEGGKMAQREHIQVQLWGMCVNLGISGSRGILEVGRAHAKATEMLGVHWESEMKGGNGWKWAGAGEGGGIGTGKRKKLGTFR